MPTSVPPAVPAAGAAFHQPHGFAISALGAHCAPMVPPAVTAAAYRIAFALSGVIWLRSATVKFTNDKLSPSASRHRSLKQVYFFAPDMPTAILKSLRCVAVLAIGADTVDIFSGSLTASGKFGLEYFLATALQA
eukprot:TRINITY_DN45590_c0_g2_i1.p2 TRINITY_DN45590_c0_g2~~TRINITY_DN45590_c0_g2_i1.p2  ORF type:complete len:152 (+),score=15.09 TRINITY_DN45590_c0_g2_i1:53-457(+)